MPRRWLHSFVSLYRFGKAYETLHYDKDKPHRELDYHHREVKHGERIGWLIGTIKKVCDLTNVPPPLEFLDEIKEHVRNLPPEDWIELSKQIWEELPEGAQASVLHELMDLEYSSFSRKEKNSVVNDAINLILNSEESILLTDNVDWDSKLVDWMVFPDPRTWIPEEVLNNLENPERFLPPVNFKKNKILQDRRVILQPGDILEAEGADYNYEVKKPIIYSSGVSSFQKLENYVRKTLDSEGMKGLV